MTEDAAWVALAGSIPDDPPQPCDTKASLEFSAEEATRLVVESIPGLVGLLTPGGEVQFLNHQIKTEREDGHRVRLSVRDAGMGLPPQDLDSLFDAFHTTKSGGMGLGLFVSRSILEAHQGRLWAEPNDGPGATFSFSIPFQTA